jgi:pimeloyl-ACP methyl ester carboxylesterase
LTGPFAIQYADVGGHRFAYRRGGEGPAIVLLHGIAGSSSTWRQVMPRLAQRYTVVAPDLLGHGRSSAGANDLSPLAHAAALVKFLDAVDVDTVTIVGHSLGGGLAALLAAVMPERCERLVLVAAGGLGNDLSALFRFLTLPGAEVLFPMILTPPLHIAADVALGALGLAGVRVPPGTVEFWRHVRSLTDFRRVGPFLGTLRAVADTSGQLVRAADHVDLAGLPPLIVWGAKDRLIPVSHAYDAHAAIPGSRLAIAERAGHFVHVEEPAWFFDVVSEFLERG